MGSPNEGASLLNEAQLKSLLSLGLLLPGCTANVFGTRVHVEACLLCPILVLSSTSRSFAQTGVGGHSIQPSSVHTGCPHHSSKQLPLGHSQANRCMWQQHSFLLWGQSPGEKPAHASSRRDLGPSGQGSPVSLVWRICSYGEMCEPGGTILMTLWILAAQRGPE